MPRLQKPNKYALYEASVQAPDWDCKNLAAIYRATHGREARILREDFCSTAAISYAWVKRDRRNRAFSVDLDREPLAWAQRNRGRHERITFMNSDVRKVQERADIACALNFSWWIFRTREDLLDYLVASKKGLRASGMLILNAYGGTWAEAPTKERTRKRAGVGIDGKHYPRFTYIWEHARVNALDRNLLAYIHFELEGGRTMNRAFTYDWRMWTLPEVKDVALEAGFSHVELWREDNGKLSRPRFVDNDDCWFANVVCHR